MVKVLTALVILCLSAVPISAEVAMETVWEMNREQNDVVTSVHADHDRFGLDLGVGAYGHWESSDGLGLYVDELGLSYRGDRLLLSGGLLHHSMGQARLNEVFLSKSSPAFPSVRYDLGGDTWSYTKMLGDLSANQRLVDSIDEIEEFKRIGIHYFRWQPTPRLSLGFGEAFITVAPFTGDIFYHTVPFLPYYLVKYLPGIETHVDNCRVYGDGELVLPAVTLYGELTVTEFPLTPKDNNRKLYAITLGVETDKLLADWTVTGEICHITDEAYSNRNPEAVYARGHRSLGHPLGDDLTTVELQLKREWEQINTETRFGAYVQKLGYTDVKPWVDPVTDKVPHDAPEKVIGVKLGVHHVRNQTGFQFDLNLGYANNFEHRLGETGFKYAATAKLTWYLP
jgi:hypothetical protein